MCLIRGVAGMALLTVCQHTFQNVQAYDDAVEGVEALKVNVRECY